MKVIKKKKIDWLKGNEIIYGHTINRRNLERELHLFFQAAVDVDGHIFRSGFIVRNIDAYIGNLEMQAAVKDFATDRLIHKVARIIENHERRTEKLTEDDMVWLEEAEELPPLKQ